MFVVTWRICGKDEDPEYSSTAGSGLSGTRGFDSKEKAVRWAKKHLLPRTVRVRRSELAAWEVFEFQPNKDGKQVDWGYGVRK